MQRVMLVKIAKSNCLRLHGREVREAEGRGVKIGASTAAAAVEQPAGTPSQHIVFTGIITIAAITLIIAITFLIRSPRHASV